MILGIADLRFSYRGADVLRGVTFEVPAGCLTAILGENGSGKSTLLKTINRLLTPRSGTVRINGADVADMSGHEIARHFGYMPQRQDPAHCTVFEAVLLGRKGCCGGRANTEDLQRVEDILQLVHLENLAMRSATELSGGELQKVILARALAQEPKVLLLDEPINHLDPVNQIEVMSLLHAVTRDLGITSLVVTHNLNNALQFADRFILLKDGFVLAAGGREVLTPVAIRDVFRIDVTIENVGGIPVVVPTLHGIRRHRHFEESGRSHEHTHEVDDHVYDHNHNGEEHEIMSVEDPREEIKKLLRSGDTTELLTQAARLHGHYCPGLAFGVVAAWAGLKRLGFENTGMEELLAVVECNNCFVDGIQVATGCSLGNNALIYKDLGKTAVTIMSRKTDSAVRLVLKPRQWEAEDASDRDKEAADLFRRVVKERRKDPEASRRLKELWRERSFHTVTEREEDLFDIRDVPAVFPEYAPIVDSETCVVCGEQFMGTRRAVDEGDPVCLACAGTDCTAVLGKGICVLQNGRFAV